LLEGNNLFAAQPRRLIWQAKKEVHPGNRYFSREKPI
jgi:hypothetical protein